MFTHRVLSNLFIGAILTALLHFGDTIRQPPQPTPKLEKLPPGNVPDRPLLAGKPPKPLLPKPGSKPELLAQPEPTDLLASGSSGEDD